MEHVSHRPHNLSECGSSKVIEHNMIQRQCIPLLRWIRIPSFVSWKTKTQEIYQEIDKYPKWTFYQPCHRHSPSRSSQQDQRKPSLDTKCQNLVYVLSISP